MVVQRFPLRKAVTPQPRMDIPTKKSVTRLKKNKMMTQEMIYEP